MGRRRKDPAGYSLGQEASAKVASRVRERIKSSGRTQAEVARQAKLEPPHLSELLRADGTRNFQRWQVVGLARALGATEEDLVGGLVAPAALPTRIEPGSVLDVMIATANDEMTVEEYIAVDRDWLSPWDVRILRRLAERTNLATLTHRQWKMALAVLHEELSAAEHRMVEMMKTPPTKRDKDQE